MVQRKSNFKNSFKVRCRAERKQLEEEAIYVLHVQTICAFVFVKIQ